MLPPRTPEERPRFSSVGTKLAGATTALILVVAAFVYVALGRNERENLFRTKEVAASAVTRLFADASAAAVEFEDESSTKDLLTRLGHNREVEYAAVWKVSEDGKIAAQLGELRRGAPETPHHVPGAVELVRTQTRATVFAPVADPTGRTIGVVAVVFSLASENAAIAAVGRRTLGLSAAVAIGLTLLLLVLARVTIVRPLRKLVRAAEDLEKGAVTDIDVHSGDEIGQLASAFRSMVAAISAREEHISARNRDMRVVLDNVGQGFITIDLDGKMSSERSRVVDAWFGPPDEPMMFSDYLSRIDAAVGSWFALGWESAREDVLPLELCLDQLPQTLRKGTQFLELRYRPLMNGEQLNGAIVVITDVTAHIESEQAEQAQREMVSVFHRIVDDRAAFEEFFSEASALVDAIVRADGSNPVLLKREIHTLKGVCALFDLDRVADFCHALEERMAEAYGPPTAEEVATLGALWRSVSDVRAQFPGSRHIELNEAEYDGFLEDLRRRVAHDALLKACVSWKFEPAEKRLSLLREQVVRLSSRLGKHNVDVHSEPTNLRLPQRRWAPFWSAFSHMVRNAVDHGVDTPDERIRAGKAERVTITLGIVRRGPHVVVSIHDDGHGIDWSAIGERAKAIGLPHLTPTDLRDALFADGVSSRENVTRTSGRGVGLSAVRAVVDQLGGNIEITTEPGHGTTFRFVFPDMLLVDDITSTRPEAPRSSAKPRVAAQPARQG
jgi:two-component system chemotaxis sensor kinase CheA